MDAWRPKNVEDLKHNKVTLKVKVYYVGYVIVILNDTRSTKRQKYTGNGLYIVMIFTYKWTQETLGARDHCTSPNWITCEVVGGQFSCIHSVFLPKKYPIHVGKQDHNTQTPKPQRCIKTYRGESVSGFRTLHSCIGLKYWKRILQAEHFRMKTKVTVFLQRVLDIETWQIFGYYVEFTRFESLLRCRKKLWNYTVLPVRGSNPGGGEIFRTRPDRPWGPPSLLYNEYRVFPGSKAAGAWCWPPTTF
jgi:hypothetical protein